MLLKIGFSRGHGLVDWILYLLQPVTRIQLKIENLQLRNSSVSGINLPALLDQRAGEVLSPVVFCVVQPLERNLLFGSGFHFGAVNGFVQLRDATQHLVGFAGVAA